MTGAERSFSRTDGHAELGPSRQTAPRPEGHLFADEERRRAEQQRGEQARPPVPDWVFERGLNRGSPPVAIHVGGCHMAGKRMRGVPRDVALRALAEGVEACGHCRPDAELGYVDG